jgi:predicted PurR-regulated permease PerM
MVVSMVLAILLVIGIWLALRFKPSDKLPMALSLAACSLALAFAPLLRMSGEEIGILIFIVGLFPVLGTIMAAVIASAMRYVQTRQMKALPSLVLSIAAIGLAYINFTTPFIWPYRK